MLAGAVLAVRVSSSSSRILGQLARFHTRWVELRGGVLVIGDDQSAPEYMLPMQGVQVNRIPSGMELRLVPHSGPAKQVQLRFTTEAELEHWSATLVKMAAERHVTAADFEVIAPIGKGGSGKVFLVRDKLTGERLAMKVIPKYDVMESSHSMRHAVDERYILEMCRDEPYTMQLRYAFQSDSNLYMVSEFYPGGDLQSYLRRMPGHRMDEREARVLLAEIVVGLDSLHSRNIVHRDLKPENLLIDGDGHIVIGDFGLAKGLPDGAFGRTNSFCGTREYLAPEVVQSHGYGLSVDIWALGVILYRALADYTPFYRPHQTRSELFRRITFDEPTLSKQWSPAAADLLSLLLSKNDSDRPSLGQLKQHPFFAGIEWSAVRNKQYSWSNLELSTSSSASSPLDTLDNFNVAKLAGMELDEPQQQHSGECKYLPLLGLRSKSRSGLIAGYSFSSVGSSQSLGLVHNLAAAA